MICNPSDPSVHSIDFTSQCFSDAQVVLFYILLSSSFNLINDYNTRKISLWTFVANPFFLQISVSVSSSVWEQTLQFSKIRSTFNKNRQIANLHDSLIVSILLSNSLFLLLCFFFISFFSSPSRQGLYQHHDRLSLIKNIFTKNKTSLIDSNRYNCNYSKSVIIFDKMTTLQMYVCIFLSFFFSIFAITFSSVTHQDI